MNSRIPVALKLGEGDALWFLDYLLLVKTSGKQTDGAVTIIEHLGREGSGTPLHMHTREDEWFYILDGKVQFWVADGTFEASTGAFVYGPRGIPHAFRIASPTAKFLLGAEPAGFENFVRALAQPAATLTLPPLSDTPPDFEKLGRVAAEFGIEILGPPPWMA